MEPAGDSNKHGRSLETQPHDEYVAPRCHGHDRKENNCDRDEYPCRDQFTHCRVYDFRLTQNLKYHADADEIVERPEVTRDLNCELLQILCRYEEPTTCGKRRGEAQVKSCKNRHGYVKAEQERY
ncbi:MAG: hypothetical protein ABFD82_00750 [Syntrophaceae bacterium]